MAKLPEDTRLKTEKAIEDEKILQAPRSYLGMSGLGGKCSRAMWYGFRLCSKRYITPRENRLFQRGHREEPIIVADLEAAGMVHYDDQAEVIDGHGHIKGHCDGKLRNVPDAPKTDHLAEFKTANDKNFKDMVKKAVKKSKPVYYGQMVLYMYKFRLKRALFVMVNKNDDKRYYERVSCDNKHAKELIQKGIDIISSEVPLEKIGSSTWFECKWCDHYELCHFGAQPEKTCRSCMFCDIHNEGKWACSMRDTWLTWEVQQKGCSAYRLMEGLIG